MCDTQKKRVLLGLFGLSRTFKTTSQSLFKRLISPNKDKYDFDIYINTDYEGAGITGHRPDTLSGVSIYRYNDKDLFAKDLMECYNQNGQVKDISIFNVKPSMPILPWFVVYKRIQLILQLAVSNPVYDVYIMLRMDCILTRPFYLDELNNECMILTGVVQRPAFFHNRDTDFAVCGTYAPFMMWILSAIHTFESILSFRLSPAKYYDSAPFCDASLVSQWRASQHIILEKTCRRDCMIKHKVHHTDSGISDTYHVNTHLIYCDILQYYNTTQEFLLHSLLRAISAISTTYTFTFSENKDIPIHMHIVR
jgi:hypothetical protein